MCPTPIFVSVCMCVCVRTSCRVCGVSVSVSKERMHKTNTLIDQCFYNHYLVVITYTYVTKKNIIVLY